MPAHKQSPPGGTVGRRCSTAGCRPVLPPCAAVLLTAGVGGSSHLLLQLTLTRKQHGHGPLTGGAHSPPRPLKWQPTPQHTHTPYAPTRQQMRQPTPTTPHCSTLLGRRLPVYTQGQSITRCTHHAGGNRSASPHQTRGTLTSQEQTRQPAPNACCTPQPGGKQCTRQHQTRRTHQPGAKAPARTKRAALTNQEQSASPHQTRRTHQPPTPRTPLTAAPLGTSPQITQARQNKSTQTTRAALTNQVVDVLLALLHARHVLSQAGQLVGRLAGVEAQQLQQAAPAGGRGRRHGQAAGVRKGAGRNAGGRGEQVA